MNPSKFSDYISIIRDKKVLFLNFFVGTITLALAINALQKPVYRTSTEVLITRNNPEIGLQNKGEEVQVDPTFFQTQFRLLKSDEILERVIAKLYPAGMSEGRVSLKGKIRNSIVPKVIPNTTIVSIMIVGENPQWVARIADTLAQVYVEYNLETGMKASGDSFIFLSQRINELKDKLSSLQKELAELEQKAGVYSFASGQTGSLEFSRADDLNERYLTAKAERMELESSLNTFTNLYREGRYAQMIDIVDDPVINNLSNQLREKEIHLASLKKEYLDTHPEIGKTLDSINVLKERIEEEGEGAINRISAKLVTLRSRENTLLKSLKETKDSLGRQSRDVSRYTLLKQEIETTQGLYESMLTKLQEIDISSELGPPLSIAVLTPAYVPENPIKPKKAYNIIFGLIFGLFLGTGVVFLDEYLDTAIKNPSDIEKYLNLPVLSKTPYLKELFDSDALHYPEEGKNSHFLESFRVLRTNVQFVSVDSPLKTLLITSSITGEGKTTTAILLAKSFARMGKKTLLVDCDMREPAIHRVFKISKEKGLSKLLIDEGSLEELITGTSVENLYVLAAGPVPPNPSELLNSKKMENFLEDVREKYDIVIIDSPPVVSVSDPSIIGAKVDGTLLVVSFGKVPREVCIEAKNLLAKTHTKIIGATLNSLISEASSYYYYYRKYYHYYPKE
jgi:polysaccharide biosynthesis transport protein